MLGFSFPLAGVLFALLKDISAPVVHPEHIILKSELTAEATLLGGRLKQDYREIGYSLVEFPADQMPIAYRHLVAKYGETDVCPDRRKRLAYTPNDPMFSSAWHFGSVNAPAAWDFGVGSPIIVAVLDTGVDITHPDLVNQIFTNAGEVANNGVDDDGNGYVDDVHGYDFAYNDNSPNDVFGHGTQCAGLIGSTMNNSLACTGLARNARILPLKSCLDSGYFYDSSTIPSYIYGANMGAKIFSMSYFADGVTAAEKTAMDYAVNAGVLPFAAAGNANTAVTYYPAGYDNVVAVGALASNTARAGFSNYGSHVDICTPGVSLSTTTPGGGTTTGFAGTSGACPVAAGCAAYTWSLQPSLTADQVRAIVEDTATEVPIYANLSFSNYGRPNMLAAARVATGQTTKPLRSALVHWVSPYFPARESRGGSSPVTRIKGRGFELPHVVQVRQGSTPLSLLSQSRDTIEVMPTGRLNIQPIEVRVDGQLVSRLPAPRPAVITYPLTDYTIANNAVPVPSFRVTLATDGLAATIPGGQFEGNLRRLAAASKLTLRLTRTNVRTTACTETVRLYDWSSASYPYGSYVTLGTTVLTPGQAKSSVFAVNLPARFIDPEGTVIIQISNDQGHNIALDECVLTAP